jgi:hypothetical protein
LTTIAQAEPIGFHLRVKFFSREANTGGAGLDSRQAGPVEAGSWLFRYAAARALPPSPPHGNGAAERVREVFRDQVAAPVAAVAPDAPAACAAPISSQLLGVSARPSGRGWSRVSFHRRSYSCQRCIFFASVSFLHYSQQIHADKL